MYETLTEKQLDILRSRYPSDRVARFKLLYRLDKHFEFNRSNLSKYLQDQGLIVGYSWRQIERVIGKPVYKSYEYRYLVNLMKHGKLDPLVLELQCCRIVQVKIDKALNWHPKGWYPKRD